MAFFLFAVGFRQAPILVTAKKAARNIVGPLAKRFPAVQIWFRRE
jgi:hypothetical protein